MTWWEPVLDLVVGNDQAMNLMDVDKGALQVLGSKKVGSQSDCPECWRSGLGSSKGALAMECRTYTRLVSPAEGPEKKKWRSWQLKPKITVEPHIDFS